MPKKKIEEKPKKAVKQEETQVPIKSEDFVDGEKEKLDIMKEVVANQKKKECEKQRRIYRAMSRITIERKG